MQEEKASKPPSVGLWELVRYFLRLGSFGFGGPIALAGYMQRDLVPRGWITSEEYKEGLAFAQMMPGPLAAQLAMWIGFIRHGVVGASLAGIVFILPPYLMVVVIAALYVKYNGFAVVQSIIFLAASTVQMAGTRLGQLAGFFVKAGAFTFGSGLAIVPFLHQGVVLEYRWLTERQFLDAVAVGVITPGPVVITAAFVGYLVGGLLGSLVAALAVFLPVYLFVLFIGRYIVRYRDHPTLKGFVKGATAAASGAIAGAAVILAEGSIIDLTTVVIALASFAGLRAFKLPEPLVIGGAALARVLLYRK